MKTRNSILEGLINHLNNKRLKLNIKTNSHLVLHSTINHNPIVKLYKEHVSTIWYIDGKFKSIILISKVIGKTTDDEESFNSKVNSELSSVIFDWIGSEEYQYVLRGEYDKYKNE